MSEAEETTPKIKTYPKGELANDLGLHPDTLRKLLNKKHFVELSKLGYEKRNKYLTPRQYKRFLEIF